ncbi:MAG: DNA-directed RNA polymerase subunit beta' [Anaerolineae bacterium]|nr:DNA-directed RNA polymerase subunit beta' [Anaerolineae bacterium]MBT7782700.1 DNA-directed RNA polymerase subunit beta' [Anaerolineae bacterium]
METKGLKALRISLASPEIIRSWSYGEVLKPETINYRRLRPEKDGLFCEAIFGPTRDWQCYCGKYKNPRYKGITCEKCGVEITRSAVRRERMGHIELASPVAHIWYTRRIPSYLGLLLNISRKNLDRVLYFAQYIITYVDEDARERELNKLDEEIANYAEQQNTLTDAKIAEIKDRSATALAALEASRAAMEQDFDEQTATLLEPVMKEGRRLDEDLQEQMGVAARKDIIFNATGDVIVQAGTIVASQHITKVQEIVREHLNNVEDNLRKEKNDSFGLIDQEIEILKATSDEELALLSDQVATQAVEIKEKNKQTRKELANLQIFDFLSEVRYRNYRARWGKIFRADMGAEAFLDILERIDLDALSKELWYEVRNTKSKQKRKKATSRLKVVEAFRRSGNKPEWMIMNFLPVIPPDLRPMVQLDGGRFATSDLNDLYRRVINRNNRLKRLLELGAPNVIIRNEKRMLQEAVDSLIDNSQRGKALSRRGRRELKSLSDMLKGKKGRFRRNLLGKRVDYSGRSVIVVGPKLKLYQCGLPKKMALELFRPFVIGGLVNLNYAANVKGARRMIERNRPEVWEVLDDVIKDRPVLLNRAPTLHRLGIQAFEPIVVEGSAIQLHPLVTTAFNADFDGDQMAVHVPLSDKAVEEARRLMLSSKNLLKPADGEPIISPSKDMVLGVYYLTMTDPFVYKGEGSIFGSLDEATLAFELDNVEVHTNIKLRVETFYNDENTRLEETETRMIDTTVGRAIFNQILPPEIQFVNETLDKGGVKDLIADVYEICGQEETTRVADRIKAIGFEYAMRSGVTIAIADIAVPDTKKDILKESLQEVELVQRDFRRGLLTENEQDERVIQIWQDTTKVVGLEVRKVMDPNGNLATMADSGATKGGYGPISQLAGMRGLMADPAGRIIPLPIRSNFREGLTALEYFISSHGARKGLADTALRTADAGYLTRRLVDVAQDLIVNEHDCETTNGITIRRDEDIAGQALSARLHSRLLADRLLDPQTGEVIGERNDTITQDMARKIMKSDLAEVFVRSPMTCSLQHGVCAKCYGNDLGRGELVELGSAVGIVAAQSIGEPGTQLTLRTFHTGGVAAGSDITTGLPRVEELFEARKAPKGEAVMSEIAGKVRISQSEKYADLRTVIVENSQMVNDRYEIPEGWEMAVGDEDEIKAGTILATHEEATVSAENDGKVRIEDQAIIVSYEQGEESDYDIPTTARVIVSEGDYVEAGQSLTEGSLNPHSILRIQGIHACQIYLMGEVQQVYRSQGQNIHDKHFETIIRKMLSKVQITHPHDSNYLPGDVFDRQDVQRDNEVLLEEGKQPARFINILLGITKASLNTDSFLSAASFQHTIKVLAKAAIGSDEDPLYGLKENVIIGKLIPAGSGFVSGRFDPEVEEELDEEELDVETEGEVDPELAPVMEAVAEATDSDEEEKPPTEEAELPLAE